MFEIKLLEVFHELFSALPFGYLKNWLIFLTALFATLLSTFLGFGFRGVRLVFFMRLRTFSSVGAFSSIRLSSSLRRKHQCNTFYIEKVLLHVLEAGPMDDQTTGLPCGNPIHQVFALILNSLITGIDERCTPLPQEQRDKGGREEKPEREGTRGGRCNVRSHSR